MDIQWIKLLTASIILLVVDIPWLTVSSSYFGPMLQRIQGSPLELRYLPALVVYVALAYLVLQVKTTLQAFYTGAAVYAVYDFTNLATIKKYDLSFAIADTLWGGVLFALTHFILKKIE